MLQRIIVRLLEFVQLASMLCIQYHLGTRLCGQCILFLPYLALASQSHTYEFERLSYSSMHLYTYMHL